MIDHYIRQWTKTTAELNWGEQRAFTDALNLVKEGKVHMVHSSDYSQGYPCLVNSVAQMTTAGGGQGVPSSTFSELVHLFDQINRHFIGIKGYNNPDDNFVSPGVAEILLYYFAPMRDKPVEKAVDEAMQHEAFANGPYREPKDADMMQDWLNAMQSEAFHELKAEDATPSSSEHKHRTV